jgi:hypothetical protein
MTDRVCGRGHAWREAVCRAHVSFRVPSLHRQLWMHDTLLTCVPLTQARIAAMEFYSGPADTCVLVRDAYARLTS